MVVLAYWWKDHTGGLQLRVARHLGDVPMIALFYAAVEALPGVAGFFMFGLGLLGKLPGTSGGRT
jgi:hypothetical protein